jgi:hypothetical protein
MDNASWHHSEKILQMCQDAGVVLESLSPYSPDFNPIEEYFGVLKKFIKKKWHENEDFISREFKMFLEWCVDVVGDDASPSATWSPWRQNIARYMGFLGPREQ